jgi:hypothetical protein
MEQNVAPTGQLERDAMTAPVEDVSRASTSMPVITAPEGSVTDPANAHVA